MVRAAVLGVLQGLTEFLPVSSSAHLALVPRLTGWPDQGLAYDVALHMGTLLALVLYFWRDWFRLTRAGLSRQAGPDRRLFWGLVLATFPAVVVGLLFEDRVEELFRGPRSIAFFLALFGVLLAAADRFGRGEKTTDSIGWRGCLLIGVAQALAVMPGVSRSGVTLTAGLFLGLSRVESARFSFLLAMPVVFGAGVLSLRQLTPAEMDGGFWLGIACSALTGVAVIRFLLDWLGRRGVLPFAVYRLVLAGALFFLL